MNDGTFFEGGVDLNPEFQEMRNRGKTNFQISKQAKENLERSILEGQDYGSERPYRADNTDNFASTLSETGQILGNGYEKVSYIQEDENKA